MYAKNITTDGKPAFEIEGTFQINDTIYVLTDDADMLLLSRLSDFGYRFEASANPQYDGSYIARQSHRQTKLEILSEFIQFAGHGSDQALRYFVDLQYKGQPRISLKDASVHNKIISASSHRHDVGYYNRPREHMSGIAISRMSGFVKNMVDVPFDAWTIFVNEARLYHAKDFIRRLAHWTSQQSDLSPRTVRGGQFDGDEVISGADDFKAKIKIPFVLLGHKIGQSPS